MEVLDISYVAILKIIGTGIFVYLLLPLLLVLRDLVLLKVIESFILTNKLQFNIRICEFDRWVLTNKYCLNRSVSCTKDGVATYRLDGEQVSKEVYDDYEARYRVHFDRFNKLDASINARDTLIASLTKHYKSEQFKSPISELRNIEYEAQEEEHA